MYISATLRFYNTLGVPDTPLIKLENFHDRHPINVFSADSMYKYSQMNPSFGLFMK